MVKKIYISVFLLISLFHYTHSQERKWAPEFSAGYGFPEYFNIEIITPVYKKHFAGCSFGTYPEKNASVFAFSINHYWHFGGNSVFTYTKPWYIRQGVSFTQYKPEKYDETHTLYNLVIGRDFNISAFVGVRFDIGPSLTIFYEQKIKDENCRNCKKNDSVFTLGGSIKVYFRMEREMP